MLHYILRNVYRQLLLAKKWNDDELQDALYTAATDCPRQLEILMPFVVEKINVKNEHSGMTSMHRSAKYSNMECLSILLEKGGDISVKGCERSDSGICCHRIWSVCGIYPTIKQGRG